MFPEFCGRDWALTEPLPPQSTRIIMETEYRREGDGQLHPYPLARIVNGRISASVNWGGVITFYRDGKMFLREYFRSCRFAFPVL